MEPTQKQEATQQEKLLVRYCELRQQVYSLLTRSMEEGSRAYDDEMKKLHKELEQVMSKL